MNGYGLTMEELVNFVQDLQLHDLPLIGAMFTYFGNREVVGRNGLTISFRRPFFGMSWIIFQLLSLSGTSIWDNNLLSFLTFGAMIKNSKALWQHPGSTLV